MANAGDRGEREAGSAMVEFLGVALLLLVPLLYLVVAFSRVQAATYAAELAAREAARGAVVSGVAALERGVGIAAAMAAAQGRAQALVWVTAEDFGFDPGDDVTLTLACTSSPCLAAGSDVRAEVELRVALPGVPAFIRSWIPLEVTVVAEADSPVDGYASPP